MMKLSSLSPVLCLCLLAKTADAATTTYTSQADFLAALGSAVVTYNFDATPSGTLIENGDSINGATFTYNLIEPDDTKLLVDNFFDTTSGPNYLGTDDGSGALVGGDEITLSFNQTIFAIGLYVISADLIFDNDFLLSTNNGQSVSNSAVADLALADGEAYFIGLIEDDFSQGFNSITLGSVEDGYLFNVDDISVSAVPLPAGAWLFGSALLCLAGWPGFKRSTRSR